MDDVEKISILYANGSISSEEWWYKGIVHRIGRPARIKYTLDGSVNQEEWFNHGILHRLDGPAVIVYWAKRDIAIQDWYINGKIIDPPFDSYPLSKEQQIELKLKYG